MSRIRSSVPLLVMLAALLASAAYGQVLTETPGTVNLGNYTVGSETVLSTTFTVTAATATTYTAATTNFWWFTVSCATYSATPSGDLCTVTLVPTEADDLMPPNATGTITLSIGGTQDSAVTVNMNVNPLLPSTSTVSLTYIKTGASGQGPASQAVTITDDLLAGSNSYTLAAGTPACPPWILTSSAQTMTATPSQADSLTFSVDNTSSVVNTLNAGSGSCVINMVNNSTNVWPFTVNWTVYNVGGAGASPLSLQTPGTISLTYAKFGGAQASATSTATILSSDSTAGTMTLVTTALPPWLTAVPVSGHTTTASGTPGQIAFTVVSGSSAADAITAGAYGPYSVTVSVPSQPSLTVAVSATISGQGVTFNTTSAAATCTLGCSAISIATAPKAISTGGSVSFTSDPATLPLWLSTITGAATATPGTALTITGNSAVLPGMGVGNYSAHVGFLVTTTPANGVSEFYLTVTLTISSTAATISLGSSPAAVIVQPTNGTLPVPVVTAVASNGDIGFTIGCAATSTNPNYVLTGTGCKMQNGGNTAAASITAIAYTWGTPLNVVIDPALFAVGTPFGTQVVLTVTVTAPTNGSTAPAAYAITYNFQPIAATLSSISPPSTIVGGTSPVNVVLSGANFLYPSEIVGSSLAPTEVFISTTASAAGISNWTRVTANLEIGPTAIVVSIPASSLPTFTPTALLTKAELYIGVANQTGATAPNPSAALFQPDAHVALDVTSLPVIQAITSTATFVQPNPGSNPNVTPYELVSIFGANFGATGNVIAAPDSVFNKYPTSLVVGTTGSGSTLKNITLSVSVTGATGSGLTLKATTYAAPILFANANQINVVVPGGLNPGTVQVAVSSGTASPAPASDNFPVTYTSVDPGVFTLTSAGTGQGAIVNAATYAVNGQSTPAVQGTDTIAIYMTGLGNPNSVGTAVAISPNTAVYPTNCISPANYLTLVNTNVTTPKYTAPTPIWTGLEGALMSKMSVTLLPPCFVNSGASAVTVSFNGGSGQAATYAGLVDGSVAGLYQVNVPVPSALVTGSVAVKGSLTVTINGITSPPVDVWIHP